jgi:MFS family permease
LCTCRSYHRCGHIINIDEAIHKKVRSGLFRQFILFINLLALIIEGVIQVPNIWVLLTCRIFQGIFVGNYMAIVPIYINDLSPKQLVASFGVYTNLFVVVAIVICFTLQIIFEDAIHLAAEPFWRIIWAANSFVIVIQSILLLVNYVPESPNSYIMKGNI